MAQAAVAAETATEFPARVALAMWACESHWGDSLTGDFNYWGITLSPEHGAAKFCDTHEWLYPAELNAFRDDERASAALSLDAAGKPVVRDDGRGRYSMKRWFASYPTAAASMTAYVSFIINSPARYKAAWQGYLQNRDADQFLLAVLAAGYATGDAAAVEIAIAHQSNITHAIDMARGSIVS